MIGKSSKFRTANGVGEVWRGKSYCARWTASEVLGSAGSDPKVLYLERLIRTSRT